MKPELSRVVALDTIGAMPRDLRVEADADERRRLAGRFGWIGIDHLDAEVRLTARAGGVEAHGRLRATLDQKCVATGDPVREAVDTEFTVRFVDVALLAAGDGEVEVADDELDVIEFIGSAIDVGEAVAQTLALSVAPFPRCADADAKLRAAGVVGASGGGAFSGLKGLLEG